ncbi:MAG: hypothetical protein KKD00_00575, partial [Gammaproteobacteria bacterium]|nr:hypothetical protein [Gammaproteobacteria bacterium]
GRLQDRYAFSLSVDTLFRATMATQGFDPLMSVSTVDGRGLIAGSRAVVGNSLTVEYYLTAGDYVLQASSWIAETALPPRSGSYQLTLTDALAANQIQGECGYGTTLTIPGAVINGQLNSADCTVENEGITYTRDSYWLQLLPGQIVYPSLLADYPVAISYWHNGVFQRTYSADAGELLRLSLNQSGSHILSVAGRSDLELGDYQLTMGLSQPEVETIPIAFSYTFNSFSNVVDGVQQTGVSDHVLEGIVDAVMVDDDVFEVIALREATLDGNVYTIGEKPGIVAIRANQPALMSLSGSVLDVQICPNGFTSGTDCPFGAEGGFLISNFWPSTGPNAGQTNALAGHPALGAAYRDRSYPVVPGNWSAALVTEGISQRDVLIALYNAAGGDSWTSRAGWLGAGGTECDWYGVLCDSEGRVTALDLGNNNLTGTLPSALTLLGNLTALNLANNNLTGSVPEFSQSVTVNVSGNPLSEPAPAQQIYLSGSSTVFKGVFNNLPFFYNVSDGDATLTGVGVHVHYSSSQVDSISFANVLNTSLLAADASGSADINDLDNDPLTDRYITIGWTDINGTWPGSLPRKLMDLRVRISDVLDADDQLVLNFSRTSNTTGYDLELPRLTLDVITATLDVDGNGQVEALTDALMIIRNLFGFSGASLIDRAVANNATFTTAGDIQARLLDMRSILDVDGNGSVDALTDGLMIMRYLFGFRGNVLIANAIANNATRTTATQIEDYLAGLVP